MIASAALARTDFEDCVRIDLSAGETGQHDAAGLLARVLHGCVAHHPPHVRRWMRLRNLLVRPLRLRTSEIGCPVSSLLSGDRRLLFACRFPVLAILHEDPDQAEVVLGANDRHLRFRSRVAVWRMADGGAQVTLTTAVQTLNVFGNIYMHLVEPVHRRWIAPAILRAAVEYALAGESLSSACAGDTPRCAMR